MLFLDKGYTIGWFATICPFLILGNSLSDFGEFCFRFQVFLLYATHTWISIFGKSTSEPIAATVKSITDRLDYIHNAWKKGYSNAVCEGNNNVIQTLKDLSFGIHNFDYFRTRSLLIVGSPGVARELEKKHADDHDCHSFFFDDFPSLEEYTLAYDWTDPDKDFSKEGDRSS